MMTPKERAAMQQALKALQEYRDTQMIQAPRKSIEALREALADPVKLAISEEAFNWIDANAPMFVRKALAEPQITTPDVCGEVCARAKLCYGCNRDLEEANAKYVEQAEQKPFEYLMEVTCTKCGATESGVLKFKDKQQVVHQEPIGYTSREWIDWILSDKRPAHASTDALIYKTSTTWSPVALYVAPVRTKDLTDDEIEWLVVDTLETWNSKDTMKDFARAVITAYKEKNK